MREQRPNVLFILGESHAPDLLGARGNAFIRTPNLDRLAKRGALFGNAYCASPLCVPARAALATGRFPHETGYWDSSMAFDGRVEGWVSRLRDVGYDTAGIGKMHYRRDDDDYGFNTFTETMHIADGVGDLIGSLRYCNQEPTYEGLWRLWTSRYGAGDSDPYRQYDERIVSEAVDWLAGGATSSGAPWALSVHFIAAHAPFIVPQEYLDLYDPDQVPDPVCFDASERPDHPSIAHLRRILHHEEGVTLDHVRKVRAAYFATISYLDHLVGRLLDSLDELGLTDTTQVIYTSDHGFSCGDHYIFGLFHLMEESVKVPLIMAGPGISRGAVIDTPVSHVDLSPTIMEICGVSLPDDKRATGAESLRPLASGEAQDHGPVFAEYHGCCTSSGGFVLRDGPMKLIYFVDMEPQLFDLSTDPGEARDLGLDNKYEATLGEMIGKLGAVVDPEIADNAAKDAQRRLIERHGGKDAVIRDKGGFSHSPPPGMSWRMMP